MSGKSGAERAEVAEGACGGGAAASLPLKKNEMPFNRGQMVSIPFELLRRAQIQAGKMKEASSFNPGRMEECPYDRNHRMPAGSMSAHMLKCRKNYEDAQLLKEEQVLFLACKYNYRHQCPAPELLYHEARCEERHEISCYLYPNWEDQKFPEEELDKMYDGCYLDHFIGSDHYKSTFPLPLEDLRHPRARMEEERMRAMEAQEAENQESAAAETEAGTQAEEEDDDDDGIDWENDSGRKWDYAENLNNPTRPFAVFPTHLKTKSERREYSKFTVEWTGEILEKGKKN